MTDLKKRFNAILQDIEKNVNNKEDLDYVKTQVYNISLLFLDELDKLAEINLNRLNTMINREKELETKIENMEKIISNLEKEIYSSDDDTDFEIVCPYCNSEFVEDFRNGLKHEVRCPECDNIIELDWNEEELETDNYSNEENDEEYDNNDEDDMWCKIYLIGINDKGFW